MKILSLLVISILFLQTTRAQQSTPAIFPGGEEAWNRYLDTAFHKDDMAKAMTKKEFERFGKEQKVVYYYSVMADGSIGLIKIEGFASQPIRNEILRVLNSTPKWTPATLNGQPTNYRRKQSSTFTFD